MYKIPPDIDWSFLIGKEITQVCIGVYDIQLHFGGDISLSILCDDNPATSFQHSTESLRSSAALGTPHVAVSLVSLIQAKVKSVVVDNPATLVIEFSNGEILRVFDSSEMYESFTISGPLGLIVV